MAGQLGFSLLAVLAVIVVQAVVSLASMHIGVTAASGGRPDVVAAVRGVWPRVLPVIGWQLLSGLVIAAGFCALALPGIYLYLVFMILPGVVLFERSNAFGRTFQLFHRDFGTALGRVATILGLFIAASLLISVLSGAVGLASLYGGTGAAASAGGTLGRLLVSVVGQGAVAVLTAPMLLTAYADIRARNEPLTTAVLAAELAGVRRR